MSPTWTVRVLAAAAVAVVGWCAVTAWPAVVHGHPSYAALLGATLVVAVTAGALTLRGPAPDRRRRAPRDPGRAVIARRLGGVALALVVVGWLGLLGWLRPFSAVEPAPSAMVSDAAVTVTDSATRIILRPVTGATGTGIVFQPGARVEARAYAAALRPLAEAGTLVVVPKQPLGIGFLAAGAFESARADHPEVERWVVGGHSLGGTVASLDAAAHGSGDDGDAPLVGLVLWASYPASDLSRTLTGEVLSVSADGDGLATPADIEASRADLPQDTTFVVVPGAVHASFGDYGPQPGDGTPTLDPDEARRQITGATLTFLDDLPR
ncbi:alpha/beta hydrolase [Actinotalea sp. K2]|uniref:alpha/beta hydrolase n=1 Tax=Actinotalea sp. K2 TaxID=2939438 RepID=UPI002016A8B6|nr:alpha/beta hydrolase [Actinotalea sp. K2]MCL3859665.1 alpha/beta hydrolase [Actinotalea sp. K2]